MYSKGSIPGFALQTTIIMRKRLHYLIIILMITSNWVQAQSLKWVKIESAKTTDSDIQSQFQEMLQDKSYSLGSENLPSPRFGASSWQTGNNEWIIFSGIGYDPEGRWGLLDDMWKYNTSDNSWILLSGQRKVDTQKWTEQTESPIPRRNAISWSDNQENLYLMGGTRLNDTEYFYDLWKYTVKDGIWTRISAKTTANLNAVWGIQKGGSGDGLNPGSRAGSASWTDKSGNLWLFGGYNMDNNQGHQDLYNDLWMFSVKKQIWTWVSGSDQPNEQGKFGKKGSQSSELAPAARANAAAWYDNIANKLWLYGGNGIDTTGSDRGGLADLWSYNIGKNVWQWVGGSVGLYANNGSSQAYPGYRWSAATWKDKEGNFMLYGGQNKISVTEIDINPTVWKFNPVTEKWSRLLIDGAPGIMSDAEAFTDALGNLLLFGGRKLNSQTMKGSPTNEIWKIKTN